MIKNILYISTFFIAYLIIYLVKKDLKIFKPTLYQEINEKIWVKIYCMVTILFIHSVWLASLIFLCYKDENYIFGFPLYLIITYIIFLSSEFIKKLNPEDKLASNKINFILNIITIFYLIGIIVLISVPNQLKSDYFYKLVYFMNKTCIEKILPLLIKKIE
jgi:UDP-N-acetylmuramyl pentapeptide phosphotransferase/UDP-N-acetylglucosamine-1-phosphate transferase